MNKLDKKYTDLLQDILDNGTKKMDRTGTGTISVFGREIRHKMSEGFPLLTTKKMYFKGIVVELLWFLRGNTNIKYLVDNNCHIWDGDAYKRFQKICQFEIDDNHILPNEWMSMSGDFMSCNVLSKEEFINKIKNDDEFSKKWGELGPIYGSQWRHWKVGKGIPTEYKTEDGDTIYESVYMYIDQIANLISDLKTNPDSRRLLVTAWNPGSLDEQILPPCHFGFQCYTRELSIVDRIELASKKYSNFDIMDFGIPFTCTHENIDEYYPVPRRSISLKWYQRSVDIGLGGPANIQSYSLLLMMIAKQVNMIPEEIIGSFGDCHIYLDHIEGLKEQIKREPYPLPTVKLSDRVLDDISEYTLDDIIIENYQCHPKIYLPLSN